jgi:hypothetical protein
LNETTSNDIINRALSFPQSSSRILASHEGMIVCAEHTQNGQTILVVGLEDCTFRAHDTSGIIHQGGQYDTIQCESCHAKKNNIRQTVAKFGKVDKDKSNPIHPNTKLLLLANDPQKASQQMKQLSQETRTLKKIVFEKEKK